MSCLWNYIEVMKGPKHYKLEVYNCEIGYIGSIEYIFKRHRALVVGVHSPMHTIIRHYQLTVPAHREIMLFHLRRYFGSSFQVFGGDIVPSSSHLSSLDALHNI